MPDHLQQVAATATEAEQMTAQRIAMQHLLNLQRQDGKPFRMSVWPVASHTRTPVGIGIIGAARPEPQPQSQQTPLRLRPNR